MCLIQSLGKYSLNCYATKSQLQEYISGKFRDVLEQSNQEKWPIKIAARAVGLRAIDEENPTVKQINLDLSAENWVLNRSSHITADGHLIHPKWSSFMWMSHLMKRKK